MRKLKTKILNKLKKGQSYEEIERIAKQLICELEPILRDSSIKKRFNVLNRHHLEKLGYKVFEIGVKNNKDRKKLEERLKKENFLYVFDCYFNQETKEVFSIRKYLGDTYVSIENDKSKKFLDKLISLDDYQNLVADDMLKILDRYQRYRKFINSFLKKMVLKY